MTTDTTKKTPDISATVDEVKNILTIDVKGLGQLALSMDTMSESNRRYATLHGMKQRIIDAAAKSKGATLQEKFDSMEVLVNHYMSGAQEWSIARASGGTKSSGGIVLRALANVRGESPAQTLIIVDKICAKRSITRSQYYAKIKTDSSVAAEILRLESLVATDIDADDLMAEMDEIDGDE